MPTRPLLYSEGSFWGPRGRHRMAAPDAPPYKQLQAMWMDSGLPSMERNQDKKADAASKYRAAKDLGELYEAAGLDVPSPQEGLEAVEGPGAVGPEPGTLPYRTAQKYGPGRQARRRGVLQKQRTRRAAEGAAREAVEGGDAETLSRLLGRDVRDTGETGATDEGAPIQKVWNVGGRRVLQQQLVTEAMAAARRRAGEVLRGKADVGFGARLGVQLPAARPKAKPSEWRSTGVAGLLVDTTTGATMDFREPTADVYHMGDRLVEVRRDKAGRVVGKPRDRYVKPEETEYTLKTMEVVRDGKRMQETWYIPTKPRPGEEGRPAIAEEVPGDPDEVREMRLWEKKDGRDVPVLVRMRGAEIISQFYPTEQGRKLSAEERKKWEAEPEQPKRYVSWVTENVFDEEGTFQGTQQRARVWWQGEDGNVRYWTGPAEEGGVGQIPTEGGAGMGAAAGAARGAEQPAAPPEEPTGPPPLPVGNGQEATPEVMEQAVQQLEAQGFPVNEENLRAILTRNGWTAR